MARLARLVLPGQTHWVIQRGHSGGKVFADEQDRRSFLTALFEAAAAEDVHLHAYALLDTEVQLLATPSTPSGLSRMMQALGRRYVAAHNKRHGRSGTLWDGRFRCAPVQPGTTRLEVLQLVDHPPRQPQLNAPLSLPSPSAPPVPVTPAAPTPPSGSPAPSEPPHPHPHAGLLQLPPPMLTSASHRSAGQRQPQLVDLPEYWQLGNTPFDREAAYRARLLAGVAPARAASLRQAALGGWVAGSSSFGQDMTQATARPPHPRARGRPRRAPT